jgi:hypothetical protein
MEDKRFALRRGKVRERERRPVVVSRTPEIAGAARAGVGALKSEICGACG